MLQTVEVLVLTCQVIVTMPHTTTTETHLDYGSPAIQSESTTLERTPAILAVEINGATARVRLPSMMVGPRDDGWRDVREFSASGEAFTGKLRLGMVMQMDFRVDRQTGEVLAKGWNPLVGTREAAGVCTKREAAPRLF